MNYLRTVFAITRVPMLALMRNRNALLISFGLPLVFFTAFAAGISGTLAGSPPRLVIAIVDLDASEASHRVVTALQGDPSIDWRDGSTDVDAIQSQVRQAELDAAVVLPAGFGQALQQGQRPSAVPLKLLTDPNNGFAAIVLYGIAQRAALQGSEAPAVAAAAAKPAVALEVNEVFKRPHQAVSVAMCAAGMGVLLALFGASSAGGAVLEEIENGMLSRLLSGPTTMTQLLIGKMLFSAAWGTAQMLVLFGWSSLLFGVVVWPHLVGIVLMSLATTLATSAFGLMLAMSVWTRVQLAMVSSAITMLLALVGGLFVPRTVMSPTMQNVGLVAFNAWSIDGFTKIFARESGVLALWPQLAVLLGCAMLFLALASRLSRRWEGWV